jgi:hypothetical protein
MSFVQYFERKHAVTCHDFACHSPRRVVIGRRPNQESPSPLMPPTMSTPDATLEVSDVLSRMQIGVPCEQRADADVAADAPSEAQVAGGKARPVEVEHEGKDPSIQKP